MRGQAIKDEYQGRPNAIFCSQRRTEPVSTPSHGIIVHHRRSAHPKLEDTMTL
jgi:hypothetical protein